MEKKTVLFSQTVRHFTKAKETVCTSAPHLIHPAQPPFICYIIFPPDYVNVSYLLLFCYVFTVSPLIPISSG